MKHSDGMQYSVSDTIDRVIHNANKKAIKERNNVLQSQVCLLESRSVEGVSRERSVEGKRNGDTIRGAVDATIIDREEGKK